MYEKGLAKMGKKTQQRYTLLMCSNKKYVLDDFNTGRKSVRQGSSRIIILVQIHQRTNLHVIVPVTKQVIW